MAKKGSYDWSQFTLKIDIKASLAKVFKAWTDQKAVTKWFTEKAVVEAKKGGRLYYEWLGGISYEGNVSKAVKNRSLVFTFGSKGEKVEVKLFKAGSGCTCQLRQFDMKTGAREKVGMHMGCKTGWTFFLANLKAYLEHGVDLRGHNIKKTYKQGFINS